MKQTSITILFILLAQTSVFARSKDAKLLHAINKNDNKQLVNFSKFVSKSEAVVLLGVPLSVGIYGLITKDGDQIDNALGITTSIAVTMAMSTALKHIVKRDRPYDAYPDYIIARSHEGSYSFPSSHTSGAFSLATSLTLNYRKWYVALPAYLWAGTVGYSRMHLGVHYGTDVLAGAVLGAASAWGTYEAQKAWSKHRKSRGINYGMALKAYE